MSTLRRPTAMSSQGAEEMAMEQEELRKFTRAVAELETAAREIRQRNVESMELLRQYESINIRQTFEQMSELRDKLADLLNRHNRQMEEHLGIGTQLQTAAFAGVFAGLTFFLLAHFLPWFFKVL